MDTLSGNVMLPAFVVSLFVATVGYLLHRAIKGNDVNLNNLHYKVDRLGDHDGVIDIQLAEIRVRLTRTEADILALQAVQHGQRAFRP